MEAIHVDPPESPALIMTVQSTVKMTILVIMLKSPAPLTVNAPSTVLRLTPVSQQPSPARLTAAAPSTVMASTRVRMPE